MKNSVQFFSFITTKKRYIILIFIEIALLVIYYIILESTNFDSFSNTLRYFISSLATLLAIVVTFNTLALQYHLKNMPENKDELDKQLNNIASLLHTLLHPKENKKFDEETIKSLDPEERTNATKYYQDSIKSMIKISKYFAESLVIKNTSDNLILDLKTTKLLKNFIDQANSLLLANKKFRSSYALLLIPTTYYIQELNFNVKSNEHINEFFNIIKSLNLIRNISSEIYIRNTLTNLSTDLLISIIPILVLTTAISSISNYEQYDSLFLRILFSINLSAVIIPFIILFLRLLPLLHIIRELSTIPFVKK